MSSSPRCTDQRGDNFPETGGARASVTCWKHCAVMVLPSFKQHSGINKGTVSRNLKALTAERYRGTPLVTEYETSDGKVYEVNYSIKQELLQKY